MHEADMTDTKTSSELEIAFVPADTRNISHIIMLAHRIWPSSYAGILTQEQIDNMLLKIYNPANLTHEMTQLHHGFWMAYLGEKPLAYASAYKDSDVIWLKKLYVEPAMQGRGIGVKLMHSAVSAFLPATEIRLLANPHNIPAHKFYTRMGFSKIAEVPVQMGDWKFNDFLFSMPLTTEQ